MSWTSDFKQYIIDNRFDSSALPVSLDDYLPTCKVDSTNTAYDRVMSLGYLGEVLWDGLIRNRISGLEYIEEVSDLGCILGWRLIGRNAVYYGAIGENAVDFSHSDTASDEYGATGKHSMAWGDYNIASALGSTSFGLGTKSINEYGVAFGKYNLATSADTILEIGVGTDDASRANAFEIYSDGTSTNPQATIAEITSRGDKTLITLEYLTDAITEMVLPLHHTHHEIGGDDEVDIDGGEW